MLNLYALFKTVLPDNSISAGIVQSVGVGGCVVVLPSGGTLAVRGTGTVGQHVFVRGGAIDGPAPNLTAVTIQV